MLVPQNLDESMMSVSWFDNAGDPRCERHPVNKERAMNLQVLAEYTAKVKEVGLLQGLGSEAIAVPSTVRTDLETCKFHLITAGTRYTAVYNAFQDCPTNAQVVATIAARTPRMMLLKPETPRDVLEYLRDLGNSLNDLASAITWVETFGELPRCAELTGW